MASPDPHIAPTSYALEKAVRVAARKLGRDATAEAIEREALAALASDGFQPAPLPGPRDRVSPHAAVADAHPLLHVSISAAPCASRREPTQEARLYDLLRKHMLALEPDVRRTTCLHVRDTSSLFLGHAPDVLDGVVETLGEVAAHTSVARVFGPFIDAALPENLPFIERLPEVLGMSPAVCPIIQIATPDNGISERVIEALTYALALARPSPAMDGTVLLTTNDCDRRAFGHRVHASAIVAHRREALPAERKGSPALALPDAWDPVGTADLPVVSFGLPVSADHAMDRVHPLPSGNPNAVFQLLDDALIGGHSHGGRRQLVLVY